MFDKVFCALLILFSLNSFSSSFEIQPRILNGTVSERGQFPFFVLYYGYPRDAPEVGIPCGGVLLNEKFVLTVAHCVENVIKVDVHLGSLRQFEHEEDRQVFSSLPEHLHIHPEYELKTLFNDIALIELPQPAVYTDQIRPVKFPNVCEVSTGIDLIAIGNGYDKTDGQPSEILKYTTMKTVTYDECRDNFLILDNKSSFCARSDNSAVCQGDSGGPIVDAIDHTLYGVMSFTAVGDCEKMPQGFTNAIHYFPWISGITGINFNKCNN